MTIVDPARPVTGGVDTHLDLNVAAALDPIGGLLGVAEFATTSSGLTGVISDRSPMLSSSRQGRPTNLGRWPRATCHDSSALTLKTGAIKQ